MKIIDLFICTIKLLFSLRQDNLLNSIGELLMCKSSLVFSGGLLAIRTQFNLNPSSVAMSHC